MQSSRYNYNAKSCSTHHAGNGFFLLPLILLFIFFSRASIWPVFIFLFIFFIVAKPNRSYSRRYYPQNNDPTFVNNSEPDYINKTSDINFCKNCGQSVEYDSAFCSECGFKLH